MLSWEDVAAIGERLPGVEVGAWYGTPGLHVLVRLDRVEPGQLAELIEDAWRSRGGK